MILVSAQIQVRESQNGITTLEGTLKAAQSKPSSWAGTAPTRLGCLEQSGLCCQDEVEWVATNTSFLY